MHSVGINGPSSLLASVPDPSITSHESSRPDQRPTKPCGIANRLVGSNRRESKSSLPWEGVAA